MLFRSVWGTAAFPSVYRTDIHPFAFLPHSVNWQIASIVMTIAGTIVASLGTHDWAAALLLGTGVIGLAATVQKNLSYSLRSDVSMLPGSALWYRATVAYLHFLQPFARVWGIIRGILSPPEVALPEAEPQTSRGPTPSWREATRALLLGAGSVSEDRFWSESWTSAERVLHDLVDWLRRSRAVRRIEIDEGWSLDRDVSILVGRWAWVDLRALVEEHASGKVLVRISTYLRPTTIGVVTSVALAAILTASTAAGVALRYPLVGATAAALGVLTVAFAAYRIAQAVAILNRGVQAVTLKRGMTAMTSAAARLPLLSPSLLRIYGLRSATVFVVALLAVVVSTFMLRDAATAQIIGAQKGYAGDNGPAFQAWLDTPGGVAVSPGGAASTGASECSWRSAGVSPASASPVTASAGASLCS